MIHKVLQTQLDFEHLSKRPKTLAPVDFDYHGIVVNKPWGYEYLMHENRETATWILYLNKNQATSMHCHPRKKTSLIVLNGSVETSTLHSKHVLQPLDGLLIPEKVFHSTRALSEEGAVVMEIETPPNKADLVRLKDSYGRENKGYEGISHLSFELHRYEYCFFDLEHMGEKKCVKGKYLTIEQHKHPASFHKHMEGKSSGLVAILEGELLNGQGERLIAAGEVADIEDIKKYIAEGCVFNSQVTSLIID